MTLAIKLLARRIQRPMEHLKNRVEHVDIENYEPDRANGVGGASGGGASEWNPRDFRWDTDPLRRGHPSSRVKRRGLRPHELGPRYERSGLWNDAYETTRWLVAWPCAFRLEVLRGDLLTDPIAKREGRPPVA